MKQNSISSLIILLMAWQTALSQTTLVELDSKTGDSLMVHRLSNGELWASFIITDQIIDSFANHELIVLQVDNGKPIKLDHQKMCGGGRGEQQTVSFAFEKPAQEGQWQFSHVTSDKPDILKLTGWDSDIYHHMRADRRPEVVDFPLQGALAIDSLWQQFKQGKVVTFRYTTQSGQVRHAKFELGSVAEAL